MQKPRHVDSKFIKQLMLCVLLETIIFFIGICLTVVTNVALKILFSTASAVTEMAIGPNVITSSRLDTIRHYHMDCDLQYSMHKCTIYC